jgi:cytochrome P450
MPRFAREDVYIGDTLVHAGEAVLCMFASANRDLPVTGDASRLDISRPDVRHMSFGHGVHFCLGAPLARLEGQIAFRTLLDRCQDMVLTAQPDELVKKPGVFTRRLPVLPVSFTPR